jgi:hypothetical protein
MLENKEPFTKAVAKFKMTGIVNICERVSKFWNGKNEKIFAPDTMYGFKRLS